MLTSGESMTAAALSRVLADSITGEIELLGPLTKLKYVLMVTDFDDGTAVPRKIEIVFDQMEATITIADHGAMGPAVPVDANCLRRTEAAFLDIEAHLLALGVKVQVA